MNLLLRLADAWQTTKPLPEGASSRSPGKQRRALAGIALGYGLILVITILGGRVLWCSVPFDMASYSTWAGVFVTLGAAVALIKPPRWLGIRNRRTAGTLLILGIALASIAISWPTHTLRSSEPGHRLDDFLPEYQCVEYHEARTHASMERVLDAARQASWADMPAAIFLMRLRALAAGHLAAPPVDHAPLLETMLRPGTGFLALDLSRPDELVLGMTGRPWTDERPPTLATPDEFAAFNLPGQIRVAFDIRTVDEGGGVVRVSTETRIMGNDADAQRIFARYWRLIYPGSAIIRRVWLDAIIARAERTGIRP